MELEKKEGLLFIDKNYYEVIFFYIINVKKNNHCFKIFFLISNF